MFTDIGLANVRIDKEGNVLGEKRGTQAKPHLVFSAHLDTVFPEGTDVKVKREGSVLRAPGIGDDCRGLAVLLAVARAMVQGNCRHQGRSRLSGLLAKRALAIFAAQHRFAKASKDDRSFQCRSMAPASASRILRSAACDIESPSSPWRPQLWRVRDGQSIHALGRAMAKIQITCRAIRKRRSTSAASAGNVGECHPFEAWAEVDAISHPAALKALDAKFHKAIDAAVAEENAMGQSSAHSRQTTGGRSPGRRDPPESPIVLAAVSVTKALGLMTTLDEGSTDSNIP